MLLILHRVYTSNSKYHTLTSSATKELKISVMIRKCTRKRFFSGLLWHQEAATLGSADVLMRISEHFLQVGSGFGLHAWFIKMCPVVWFNPESNGWSVGEPRESSLSDAAARVLRCDAPWQFAAMCTGSSTTWWSYLRLEESLPTPTTCSWVTTWTEVTTLWRRSRCWSR